MHANTWLFSLHDVRAAARERREPGRYGPDMMDGLRGKVSSANRLVLSGRGAFFTQGEIACCNAFPYVFNRTSAPEQGSGVVFDCGPEPTLGWCSNGRSYTAKNPALGWDRVLIDRWRYANPAEVEYTRSVSVGG